MSLAPLQMSVPASDGLILKSALTATRDFAVREELVRFLRDALVL